jgi:Flp pilus assembly protein TadB
MEEKKLSGLESLAIIEQMINTAKNEHREKGEGWLLWGWLLFVSSLLSAVLIQINKSQFVGWVWTGMTVIVIFAFIYELVTKKKKIVKTYVEELLEKFSTGFLISLLTIITATSIIANFNKGRNHADNIAFAFGYFFILYAFWMYIHGSAIRFRPLIIGAAVNWVAAITIFLIKDFKYVMIISAIAVLIGYLIPGYLLRNQYKKSFQSQAKV